MASRSCHNLRTRLPIVSRTVLGTYLPVLCLTVFAYRRLSGGSLAEVLIPRPADAAVAKGALIEMARRLPLGSNRFRGGENK